MTNEAGLEFEGIEKQKTLRDEIAIAAMNGFLSNPKAMDVFIGSFKHDVYKGLASQSYAIADSMMNERTK